MPDYRRKLPKIVWGDAYEKTLNLGYQLDEATTYPKPRDGSEDLQGSSGVEDAWDEGTDYYIEGAVRYVPKDSGLTPEGNNVTGWDGVDGWRDFLVWAWRKNVLRFYPDRVGAPATYLNCYLVAPRDEKPERESNGDRTFPLVLRTSDGAVPEGF